MLLKGEKKNLKQLFRRGGKTKYRRNNVVIIFDDLLTFTNRLKKIDRNCMKQNKDIMNALLYHVYLLLALRDTC